VRAPFSSGEQGTDGRTDWRCLNAIDDGQRIGAAILLPPFCKFRATELEGWMTFFNCF